MTLKIELLDDIRKIRNDSGHSGHTKNKQDAINYIQNVNDFLDILFDNAQYNSNYFQTKNVVLYNFSNVFDGCEYLDYNALYEKSTENGNELAVYNDINDSSEQIPRFLKLLKKVRY